MKAVRWLWVAVVVITGSARGDDPAFSRGIPRDDSFFPVAVWLQSTSNAEKYRDIGINTYVALWRGPTEEQLDALDRAGMRVVCGQSERALRFVERPTIVAWMHGDEPDNAQSLPNGRGYGPPILPSKIVEGYRKIREADPTRPVLLNLGQGVAWDGWQGRGVRTNHPEDYREYLEGCDIASFDIYPASHDRAEIAGKLWYVPLGVDRLREWTEDRKPVWACIETTRISNEQTASTPAQVRSEVWMALIHGAKGIIYFCHEFKPRFIEAGLLADAAMAREVAAINGRIKELAPVLNSPDVVDVATVGSSNAEAPIDLMVKRKDGVSYVFAVSMREGATTGRFSLKGAEGGKEVEVLGENRTVALENGSWTDAFEGYQVHLYRVRAGE